MNQRKYLIILLLFAALVLLGWLNVVELRGEEPRRAVVSLEMLFSGSYVVPQLNGWTYYNKPPLFNWVLILAYQLFQSFAEWVVRLPSLLAFFAITFIHYRVVKQALGKEIGLMAALFFLISAELLFYGSVYTGEIDLFYSLIVYGQIWAIYHFFQKQDFWRLFLISYTFVALGFLTKGLPSLAFQAFTLLGLFIWKKQWQKLFGLPHIAGILLLVVLVGAYLFLFQQQEDAWAFFVRQYKEAAQRTGLENQWGKIFYSAWNTPLELIKLLLPGSLFAGFFLFKSIRQKVIASPFLSFCILFILVNLPLYWFSGDFKPRYVYMFFPFFTALFAAAFHWGMQDYERWMNRFFRIWKWIALIFVPALFSLFFVQELEALTAFHWRFIATILAFMGVAYLAWNKKTRIWSLFFMMLSVRLGMNLFYLPALDQSDSAYHREQVQLVLDITKEEPIFLVGKPIQLKTDASIGPLKLSEVELHLPMIIAYQIPYYITRHNHHPLKFVETPVSEQWNLVQESSEWAKEQQIYATLIDETNRQKLVLIKPE